MQKILKSANRTVIVLHDYIPANAAADEKDTLEEIAFVCDTLRKTGYVPRKTAMNLSLDTSRNLLAKTRPAFIFNLVESIDSKSRLIPFSPLLLESMKIPFTGAGADAMYTTSNKRLAKAILFSKGIPTPPWQTLADFMKKPAVFPGLVKSVWEHASLGVSSKLLIRNRAHARKMEKELRKLDPNDFLVEKYIHGREFNMSALADGARPQILPPAEIRFEGYKSGQPRIVDYQAKWDPDSFAYSHTVRHFDFPKSDTPLLKKVSRLTGECWNAFNLRGYARVDFRVDAQGNPWVIDLNANPCISPDGGFFAAVQRACISPEGMMKRIVAQALS